MRESAFTLLELVLSLTLVATGTVAVGELMQRAHIGQGGGERVLTATYLAQRRLEELRNVVYADLASETKATVASPAGFTAYQREVTVTEPSANLKEMVVTVSWTVPGGEANVALRTYRSKR